MQRYYRATYPPLARRARRRLETPPGAQAQADWAEFRGVLVGGRSCDLYGFVMELSHSRRDALVWAESKDLLA